MENLRPSTVAPNGPPRPDLVCAAVSHRKCPGGWATWCSIKRVFQIPLLKNYYFAFNYVQWLGLGDLYTWAQVLVEARGVCRAELCAVGSCPCRCWEPQCSSLLSHLSSSSIRSILCKFIFSSSPLQPHPVCVYVCLSVSCSLFETGSYVA